MIFMAGTSLLFLTGTIVGKVFSQSSEKYSSNHRKCVVKFVVTVYNIDNGEWKRGVLYEKL